MPKKGVEKKHSETALFAALYRAVANKETQNERFGPDDLAEYFLPGHFKFFIRFQRIRANIRKKGMKLTPGTYEYMIARTIFFDKVFKDALEEKVPQIVLLGAGYDTRAYRFAGLNRGTRILELDIAPTQNRKKNCLQKARLEVPPQVTFAPIDFNQQELIQVLESAGYDVGVKTVFIWEGVSYYLEPDAVNATLGFVKKSSAPGSVLAFDYAISISEEDIDHYFGVKQFIQTWEKHRANELFKFSVREGDLESMLEQRGLKLVSHWDHKEIEDAFLLDATGSSIGPITGFFRFAIGRNEP